MSLESKTRARPERSRRLSASHAHCRDNPLRRLLEAGLRHESDLRMRRWLRDLLNCGDFYEVPGEGEEKYAGP